MNNYKVKNSRRTYLNQLLVASALLGSISLPIASVNAQGLSKTMSEFSGQPTSSLQQGFFLIAQAAPLTGKRQDEVKRKCYMNTKITISNNGGGNGRIDGETRTWTDVKFAGFTGGVEVVLFDEDKNILHVTDLRSYGVNGRAIPGPSDRTETWNESLPQATVDKVRSYAIRQRHTPKDRLLGNLAEVMKIVAPLITLF
jgi:hypothetical protein